MVTPIYLSDGTAIYDRLTARAFLAEKLESDSRIKDFLVYLSGENWEKSTTTSMKHMMSLKRSTTSSRTPTTNLIRTTMNSMRSMVNSKQSAMNCAKNWKRVINTVELVTCSKN